jgi:hypothetical protein
MSRRVYRYPLATIESGKTRMTVHMPSGAQVLRFGVQAGEFSLWALVNPDLPYVERVFQIVGTGADELGDSMIVYMGTATVLPPPPATADMVFHCFERMVVPQASAGR